MLKKNSNNVLYKIYYYKNNILGKGRLVKSKTKKNSYLFSKYMFYFYNNNDFILNNFKYNFFYIYNGRY